MVSASFTEQVIAAGRPRAGELRILPELGHLLFHDHLATVLPGVVEWLAETLERAPALAASSGTREAG
jgi:hypothetical protein